MRACCHALVHPNQAQIVLEDGAPRQVLGLAAVAPAVLVHMLVVLSIACMTRFAVMLSASPGAALHSQAARPTPTHQSQTTQAKHHAQH